MTEGLRRLLVPAVSSRPPHALLAVADAILGSGEGEVLLLGVVEIPQDRSLSEGALAARRRRAALQRAAALFGGRVRVEVHTWHSSEDGIRQAAQDADLMLLALDEGSRPAQQMSRRLMARPPCDIAAVKAAERLESGSVLVPARGGLHASLALRVAQALALHYDAPLTLLHITSALWDDERRLREELYYTQVRKQVTYERVRDLELESNSIEDVLAAQGSEHDIMVMGATARDERRPFPLGALPQRIADVVPSTVLVVKTREPVTASMFEGGAATTTPTADTRISEIVDRWFAENTFHSDEFRDVRRLLGMKQRQGVTISLALPTLNEEKTIGNILSTIKRRLVQQFPLIDEMVVIDSQSTDSTVEIAERLGVPVYQHPEVLREYGSFRGKGEGLWKSLQVTTGDIVVWIDSDITGIHPKFVYGLVGPLLTQPRLGFVKGFYRRPLNLGSELMTTGGGRVTELTARPLFNLFYPELSGLVQPLAGEMAGRRSVLESVPMFTGYGVETGLLIDILEQFGLGAIAQTDLQERIHRNQSLLSLSKMAFAIVQVVVKRLSDRNRLQLFAEMNQSMKLIHYSPAELFLEVQDIQENERPPIASLPEYQNRTANDQVPGNGEAHSGG